MALEDPKVELFERWRSRGDTDALARVFDATAPRLLALAVHLSGNVADAEDLVQATFLTAIERGASFDRARPLEPWLAGILSNHARDLRKSSARVQASVPEPNRMPPSPADEAGESESREFVAAAVDKLEEPYRSVLILATRHAMSPAEIAYALQRSPGAVRVQLHRGRELLRKVLPTGMLIGTLAARGLAEVRASVLARADALGSALGAGSIAGGVLVGKKLVAALAVLLAVLVVMKSQIGRATQPTAAMREPLAGENLESAQAQTPGASLAQAPGAEPRVELSIAPASESATVRVHGRIVDGATLAGIAGAEVALFAPQRATLSEVKRQWADRLWVDEWGGVEGRPWPLFGSNPDDSKGFASNFSERVRMDVDKIDVYAPPSGGSAALARAVSDGEGRFEIIAPESLGFVRCEAKGYPTRERALAPSELNEAHASELAITIAMLPPRHVHGYIVDKVNRRLERAVRLSLLGQICLLARPDAKSVVPIAETDPEVERQREQIVLQAKPDGSFEADIAVQTAWWESLEPDLAVTRQQVVEGATGKLIGKVLLDSEHADDPWVIAMIPVSAITVRDRSSGEPIEDIHLVCSRLSDGREFRSGLFFARGGRLRLSAKDVGRVRSSHQEDDNVPCLCTVWADGHVPLVQRLPSLTEGYDLEFALERGAAPSLDGEVRDSQLPQPGAFIGLFSLSQPADYWRPLAYGAIAMTSSDPSGRFRVEAPAGSYLLQVKSGEQEVWRLLELPCGSPIVIDLAIDTRVTAIVRDVSGAPCPQVPVLLRASDGRALELKTDDQGCARFSRLSAGSQRLQIAASTVGYPGDGGPERTIDLLAGEDRRVDITIAASTPRFAHLFVDGVANPVGWRAYSPYGYEPPHVDIEEDGRIPIDMCSTDVLAIESPDHSEWRCALPKGAPDGHPIRITRDGPGYDGMLASFATGKPLANVRVIARPWSDPDRTGRGAASITEADGHFRMRGLQNRHYYFSFERLAYPREDLEQIYVLPSAEPADQGPTLALAIPLRKQAAFEGLEQITVRGLARRTSGSALQVRAAIAAEFERSGYALRTFVQMVVRPDGQYEVRLPAAPRYVANFWSDSDEHPAEIVWTASGSGETETHDFDLP